MAHPDSDPSPGAVRAAPAALAALLAVLLAGCAAPGFGHPDAGAPGLADTGGAAPPAVAVAITPQLIRDMAAGARTPLPAEVQALFGQAPAYTIGAGDVVGIVVYRHPELAPGPATTSASPSDPTALSVPAGFIVDGQGEIGFPYIGRVQLQGLTEAQASALVASRIAPFVKDPLVSVRIQSFRSRRIYVEGDVRNPGLQIVTDVPMTLAEALSRAGGPGPGADRSRITLTRGERSVPIDLTLLQRHGRDASHIPLESGDLVQVGSRDDSRVYVMGEIARPSALPMRDGRLSLGQALGDAGGPDLLSSAPGEIYVVRNGAAGTPQVFHLDARNPVALALADRFALQPRDVVYVDRVALAGWNRVVSLVLPAAQIVNLGGTTGRR